MKRILAAVAGVVLMAGTVGTAAQTLEETIEWLEGKFRTMDDVWSANGELIRDRSIQLWNSGRVVYRSGPTGKYGLYQRTKWEFNIEDVEITDVETSSDGLALYFTCEMNALCIDSYRYDEHIEGIKYARMTMANYSKNGRYTARDRELVAKLTRGFLHYQALVSAQEKSDLF